jgi:DNA-binding transcriptional ArsR family regulator
MNQDEAQARSRILKALGHPARITIVDELSRGDRCGCELLPLLGIDQSVVSRHLACLRNTGLITERKKGVKVMYHLACPCILRALDCTLDVLKAEAKRRSKVLRMAGA